jgi:voltage-gated potassium channel
MINFRHHPYWRRLYASVRDTWLLFRQFQWPLVAFMGAIVGGGLLYGSLASWAGEPINSTSEAIYHILGLTFLQPIEEFPQAWYLQSFYFIMPIIGIGILAQGVADFGVLFFNRRERGKDWAMAVASTFNKHAVLVGLGHLGFRVSQKLHGLGQDVVVIEINPQADLVASIASRRHRKGTGHYSLHAERQPELADRTQGSQHQSRYSGGSANFR